MQPEIRFTFLASQLNALADKGHQLGVHDTVVHCRDRSILTWLKTNLPHPDLEIGALDAADEAALLDLFESMSITYGTNKTGVSSNGLHLLVAYCLEGIQQLVAKP